MVEKTFKLESSVASLSLGNLISDIPEDQFNLTELIVNEAKQKLNVHLSDYVYLSLTDHINFALSRVKDGLIIRNPLNWEIKNAYPIEYEVGLKAIDLIDSRLGIKLPNDEAATIALHLANAQQTTELSLSIVKNIELLQNLLNIVKYHFLIDFDENTANFERFFLHMKFFVFRILNEKQLENKVFELLANVIKQWPETYECVTRINHYLNTNYSIVMSEEEQFYLMVHIQRLTQRNE